MNAPRVLVVPGVVVGNHCCTPTKILISFCFFQSGALKRLVPLLDRVLVQRAEAVLKSKGGIVIPEKAQSKVLEGVVVAAGPGNY